MPQIKFYEYTNKKWSFCNVYPSTSRTKTIFPDTNTRTNSHKQKKLRTHLLCICVSVYSLKKSQPKPTTASTAVFPGKKIVGPGLIQNSPCAKPSSDLAQPKRKTMFEWITQNISQPVKSCCHIVNEGLANCHE